MVEQMTINATNITMQVGAGGVLVHPAVTSIYPLSVGDTHRLLTAQSDNLQINGDTVWSLAVQTTTSEVDTYITNRAAKGINAIIVNAIEHNFSDNTPAWRNKNGDLPFSGTTGGVPDFTTPVEAYWTHVDYIVATAAANDITVFLFPSYIGYNEGAEGWAAAMVTNGSTRMTTYGEWIGNRYKNKPNIVWVMGGDAAASSSATMVTALANAIKSVDSNHLMTAHSARNNSALDDYDESWLDFNSTYTDQTTVVSESENDYGRASPLPTFLIEARYANMGVTDAEEVRQAYQAMFSGCIGYFHGSDPLWYLGTGWDTNLNADAAQYFSPISALQAARDIPSLNPDISDTFVTSSKGSGQSASAFAASSSMLVGLHVGGAAHTFDLTQFSGSVNVRWYNPLTGSTSTDGSSPYANSSSSQTLTPPNTSNDWIVLIDLVSLGLGAP